MLVNSSYFKLRQLIINSLNKIIKLPDDVFLDAKVETIIFELKKNKTDDEIKVINYSKNEKISEIDNLRTITFNKKNWKKDNNLNFNLYANKNDNSILSKIEKSQTVYLEEISNFTLGITPYDKYKGHSQELIKNRQYHSKTKDSEEFKPIINGENIKRFYTDNKIQEYIKYGDWLGAKRDEKFFNSPRILVRQIVSGNPLRIFASYTEESLYFTQIGFGIISKDNNKFDNKYLLILLNSLLLNFYHKYKFLDIEKELFQKVLIANCKKFPIKKISISDQQPFIDKADAMLSLNKQLQESSSKFSKYFSGQFKLEKLSGKLEKWYEQSFEDFIKELNKAVKTTGGVALTKKEEFEWMELFDDKKIAALALKATIDTTDAAIDSMVYALYGLSEEEIKIVEGS